MKGRKRITHEWLTLGPPGHGYVEVSAEYVRAEEADALLEAVKRLEGSFGMPATTPLRMNAVLEIARDDVRQAIAAYEGDDA